MATRDDGEPICYYYIDDIESASSGGDKYLDYYQSKAMCEQRGKQSRRKSIASLQMIIRYNGWEVARSKDVFFFRHWMGARGRQRPQ